MCTFVGGNGFLLCLASPLSYGHFRETFFRDVYVILEFLSTIMDFWYSLHILTVYTTTLAIWLGVFPKKFHLLVEVHYAPPPFTHTHTHTHARARARARAHYPLERAFITTTVYTYHSGSISEWAQTLFRMCIEVPDKPMQHSWLEVTICRGIKCRACPASSETGGGKPQVPLVV